MNEIDLIDNASVNASNVTGYCARYTSRTLVQQRYRHSSISFRPWLRALLLFVIGSVLAFAGCANPSAPLDIITLGGGNTGGGNSGRPNGNSNTVAPPAVSDLIATIAGDSSVKLAWINSDPSSDDLAAININWSITTPEAIVRTHTITGPIEGEATHYIINSLIPNTTYRFLVIAVDADGNQSEAKTATEKPSIDSDNDLLIEIYNIDMLNNIRGNLSGKSYKNSNGELLCGSDANQPCNGYELTGDLDFADGASYANGSAHKRWRPAMDVNSVGAEVAPEFGQNPGWVPIGTPDAPFITTFEGHGHTISNLYVRNIDTMKNRAHFGLFGQIGQNASTSPPITAADGIVRDLGIVNGAVYGGTNHDAVGTLAGTLQRGMITDSYAIAKSASATVIVDGGAGSDDYVGGLVGHNAGGTIVASHAAVKTDGGSNNSDYVGGLVGYNESGTIIASYATGTTNGGETGTGNLKSVGGIAGKNSGAITASYAAGTTNGSAQNDIVGGLVGENTGTITASYAIGTTNGNAGVDKVGGLVGENEGTIAASYAVGDADGGAGDHDLVGGLVGSNIGSGIISQSYSAGNADGGDDIDDYVGALVGQNSSSLTESYGFGMVTDNKQVSGPSDGGVATLTDVSLAAHLTITTVPSWDTVTGGAWDLGTSNEIPLLKYADYDDVGSDIDYCAPTPAIFPSIVPGTAADPLICGTTLVSGQSDLRTRFAPPASVTSLIAIIASETSMRLDWTNPSDADLDIILISWATVAAPDTEIGNDTVFASAPAIYTITGLTTHTPYRFSVTAVDTDGYRSTPETVEEEPRVTPDPDGDNLININNLEMLNNIRHNLAGTSYKTSNSDPGTQCGIHMDTTCIGYELTTALDFLLAGSYDSGSVNAAWQPTGGTPASATNAGWTPIGTQSNPFTAIFDGNDMTITNLYARNSVNTDNARVGLFGAIGASGTVRNLGIVSSAVYGGSAKDWIGLVAGRMAGTGTVSNVHITRSTISGAGNSDIIGSLIGESDGTITSSRAEIIVVMAGNGNYDIAGGLVGKNNGTIKASYVTTTGNGIHGGGGGGDVVGGLVGDNTGTVADSHAIGDVNSWTGNQGIAGGLVGRNSGTIVANYAIGTARSNGSSESTSSNVGGLVGRHGGTIIGSYAISSVIGGSESSACVGGLVGISGPGGIISASYAVGSADGGAENGKSGAVGGLVGCEHSIIVASYTTANSDGGAGTSDYAGSLIGNRRSTSTLTDSYAFGTTDGKIEPPASSNGSTKPNGVNNPAELNSSNVGSSWNDATQRTAGAWQYGSTYGGPALKYADYDGDGGIDYCALFPTGACASNTLLLNQPVFDQGGSTNTAYEIDTGFSLGESISIPAAITNPSDRDVFKITIDQSGTLVVETKNSDMDTLGTLDNSAKTTVASDDNSGPGNNFRISHAVTPGVYYVSITVRSGQGGYVLGISLD